jgi:hypothetical protein
MRGVFVLLARRQYALKIFWGQKKNKFHFGPSIAYFITRHMMPDLKSIA